MIKFPLLWVDACAQAKYNPSAQPPVLVVSFRGYKDGKGKYFTTEAEAQRFSPHYEYFHTMESKVALEAFQASQQKLANVSYDIWFNSVREAYQDLNDNTFNLCFGKVNGDDYDKVAINLASVVAFARTVIRYNVHD